jgi:hypothetical protein
MCGDEPCMAILRTDDGERLTTPPPAVETFSREQLDEADPRVLRVEDGPDGRRIVIDVTNAHIEYLITDDSAVVRGRLVAYEPKEVTCC